MQFVACKFRPTDTRTFTYRYEGTEPLQPGDFVKVPDARSDGWKRVEVVSISDEAPAFATKPILGIYNPDAETAAAPAPAAEGDPLSGPTAF